MVVLGRIAAPFGVKGWVRIQPFADDPAAWCGMSRWWIGRESAQDWSPIEVRDCREHGGALVAWISGVDDRDSALALRGQLVAAPREHLPATAQGEYYWADLIGLEVVNAQGEVLGRVADLIATGANAVLVLREDAAPGAAATERLLPFVETVVEAVEREAGRIRVIWQREW